MKRNTYSMSKMIGAVVLAAGAVGVANADMGRFDSGYQYFFRQPIDKAPSAWRKDHPNGVSERELQANSASSASEAWKMDKPVFDNAPSEFRIANPDGLSDQQYQRLSSEASAWHSSSGGGALVAGSADGGAQDASKETLAARVARLFHLKQDN